MSETTETNKPSRAQSRIQTLTAELAAMKAERDTWKGKFEGVSTTIETLTAERDTARADLKAAQATSAQQLAAGKAGIWGEADLKAAQALHGVYGNGKNFAEWIGQDRDQLPPAVQGLLPTQEAAQAAETTTEAAQETTETAAQTTETQQTTTTAKTPPKDPGGSAPGTIKPYTPAQLQEISAGGPLFDKLIEEHGGVMAALRHVEQSQSAA
jgi:chromosome segregation ATPase